MNETIIYSIVFIYGIIIGSFLNVCIYRIPNETSIAGRSHCMKCNAPIKWYDLIPVFSYIFLMGSCRKCKTKISIQYPMIEALNGLLYVLVFYLCGFDTMKDILLSSAYCLIISALLVLSVIDFRTNIIPFGINIFIAAIGVGIVLIKYFSSGKNIDIIIHHAIGACAISFLLLIIFYATQGRAMGGGDIKLMAAAGLVLGWQAVILAFFLGCVFASIIHPIRMKINHLNRVLAFGPYLSAGITVSLLYGRQIIDWYIQTFFSSL